MRTGEVITLIVSISAGIILPSLAVILRYVGKWNANDVILARLVSEVSGLIVANKHDREVIEERLRRVENNLSAIMGKWGINREQS